MKGRTLPTLHLEWAPGTVLAMDRADNRRARGADISELGRFIRGHKEALVGVSRSCVFLKTLRLPKATPEELRRLLNLRLGQLFPVPASDLAFDAIQTEDQNAEGWLTLVAAMRAQDLVQLRMELAQAGLKATRIFPVALAAPAIAARPDALVVDKLPTGINLDVVQGGIVRFSRMAPEDANLGMEAQRTLMAAGAGPLDAVRGRTLEALHFAPEFSFALNEDRAKESKKRLGDKSRLSLLLLVSSFLLAGYIWVTRTEAQATVDKSKASWDGKLKKLTAIRDAEQAKAGRALLVRESLNRAFMPAQPLSDIIKAASNTLPEGVWLIGMNTERGKPLQLRGTAKTGQQVAQLVNSLSVSPRFRDVKLVFANGGKIEETPIVQFNVAATAVGNLPMPAPEKTGKKATRSRIAPKVASVGGSQ
ncbi:PilN domain-containing protein [Armatimonas sp.]|uniref:PilN domain-containing protein n=1 Tax=Armatimonas sp. TaxID=1872638 RepID=UPI0037533729